MPQVTITYKNPETLKKLKDLSKEYNFQISTDELEENNQTENLTPGDKTLSLEELHKVFTGKDIDAKELRRTAWKR